MKIVRFVAVFMIVGFLHNVAAFAADAVRVDGALLFGIDDYGYGNMISQGYGVGVTKEIMADPGNRKLSVRADVNYLYEHDRKGYVEWSYTRIPIYLGLRFFTPFSSVFYLEGGAEYIIVKTRSHYTGPLFGISSPGLSTRHAESDFGIVPGFGIEYPISKNVIAGINARAHFTYDPFITIGASVGYRF